MTVPMTKTLELRPQSGEEAYKPGELIRISGHQNLSLHARRAITILWANAHRQGIEMYKDYTISLSELRTEGNRSLAHVVDAIETLMTTLLVLKLPGEDNERRVQFLGGNDMRDKNRPQGTLTYSFDRRLVEVLQDSSVWGRIALPLLMAFTSKYTVSLYENACQWSGLAYKSAEEFTVEELRVLLGVEDKKYKRWPELRNHVLDHSVKEINALAPFNISVVPIKTGRAVTHVRVGWHTKSTEELKLAFAEANRPKVGRKARIAGVVEHIAGGRTIAQPMSREARVVSGVKAEILED